MAAISVGITEIEERIEAVRRRLNGGLALRAACTAATVLCTLLAIAVACGLHRRLELYGLFYLMVAAAAAAIGAVASIDVRRRWYDTSTTARLIDDRAQLADRLTTLITMRQQRRPGRLMPVLIAQLIALMPRWQPFHVAPRHVPRVAYACAASVLLLAAAVWLEPPPPQHPDAESPAPPAIAPAPQAQARPELGAKHGNPAPGASEERGTGSSSDAGEESAGSAESVEVAQDSGSTTMLDQIVAPLQQAMGQAFYPNRQPAGQNKQPQPAQSAAEKKPGPDSAAAESKPKADGDKQEGRQQPQPNGKSEAPQSGDQATSQAGEHHDPNGDPHQAPPQEPIPDARAAGRAGGGTSPGDVLDPKGTGAPLAVESNPRTFKLTLTSFLQATESSSRAQKKNGGKTGGAAIAARETGDPMLNEYQQNDDALRKAEVPAEYEEIVRRVYSARTDQ